MKSYPNISRMQKFDRWPYGIKCDVCDNHATYKVTIQTNIFRGDDEQYKSCVEHKDDVSNFSVLLKKG